MYETADNLVPRIGGMRGFMVTDALILSSEVRTTAATRAETHIE
jgi:hypothetical protein